MQIKALFLVYNLSTFIDTSNVSINTQTQKFNGINMYIYLNVHIWTIQ